MTRISSFLRQTARAARSSRVLSSLPPPSTFIPQKDFAKTATNYFVLENVSKDVYGSSNLYSTRQGTPKSAYGGLILAQSMAAAENTVPSELKPHAVHSFFILNVDPAGHVEYKVTRLRDGKSFCTRRVEAYQNGNLAFSLEVSFHRDEPHSMIHQSKMPEVAHWSTLANTHETTPWMKEKVAKEGLQLPKAALDALNGYDTFALSKEDLFELRPCDLLKCYGLSEDTSRTFCQWFKASGDLPDDEKLHRYLISYITDSVMPMGVSRPHFINSDFAPTMMFSMDHNIWLHDAHVRADQWLLYEITTTWGGNSRGLVKGQLFTEDGKLVLTAVQELLVRTRGESSVLP